MPLVVIAGDARGAGKTSLACAIIAGFVHLGWTAVKLTAHRHADADEAEKDTARYRRAGAVAAYLLQAGTGSPSTALRAVTDSTDFVIAESNALLLETKPDLALRVLAPPNVAIKPSAQAIADRVDTIVTVWPFAPSPAPSIPCFRVEPTTWMSDELHAFLGARLPASRAD